MTGPELVVLGGLTGLHAATWGAFKDTPFEGFRWRSFVRSVALGLVMGTLLATALPGSSAHAPLVVIGLLYTGERLATEWWKTFVREDPQSAYTIPMRLAVNGRPVDAALPRYLTGLAVVVALVLLATLVPQVGDGDAAWWVLVLVGGSGGWLTAVGGAWKDAPVEGFSRWKFLRSPAVASVWAFLLLPLTRDPLTLAVAAGGLSVLVIETYKTFLTGGRPPGKFAGKPVRLVERAARDRCRALHCLLYGVLAAVTLGSPVAVLPVAAALAVAMLWTGRMWSVPVGTATQKADVDASFRRETR